MKNHLFHTESESYMKAAQEALKIFMTCKDASLHRTLVIDSPYVRPINHTELSKIDFSKPLKTVEEDSYNYLLANQLLTNIYELDLVFLPRVASQESLRRIKEFYSEENQLAGKFLKPLIENFIFHRLDCIETSKSWNKELISHYLDERLVQFEKTKYNVVEAILSSKDPESAAKEYIIQVSIDFLTEASALARVIKGNYGQIQSEVFKILIDEYGYGVFTSKHSTLFEKLMKDLGLRSNVHAYWNFLLPSSYAVHNYLHYTASNHLRFFRYIGVLYDTEATFAHTCAQLSEMLLQVFGKSLDTKYFTEHAHIDIHHRRMAKENILLPLIDLYGEQIISELLNGIEQFNLVIQENDQDFINQLKWIDTLEHEVKTTNDDCSAHSATSYIAKNSVVLQIIEGAVKLFISYNKCILLSKGESFTLPKGRFAVIASMTNETSYELKEDQSLLSLSKEKFGNVATL